MNHQQILIECICSCHNKELHVKKALAKIYNIYLLKNEQIFDMFKRIDSNLVTLEYLLKRYKIPYAHLKAEPIRYLINNKIDLNNNDLHYWVKIPGMGFKSATNYLNIIYPEQYRIYLDESLLAFLKSKNHDVPKTSKTVGVDGYIRNELLLRSYIPKDLSIQQFIDKCKKEFKNVNS
jgi:hypothetical protein